MANENKINWTVVVLGAIICIGLYLIPSPLQSNSTHVCPPTNITGTMPGTPDTSGVNIPPISGTATSVVTAQPTASVDTASTDEEYDYYLFNEVNTVTEEGDSIHFATYVYPYKENDTIKANFISDWEIKVRPALEILRVDTFYVMNPVKEVPFYEKPYVVAPVTAAVVVGLVYIIAEAFK